MPLARRDFLLICCAGTAFDLRGSADDRLRGIFPIGQTPFDADGKLDAATLAAEVRFVHRCGGHGFVWPQLASEYATLTQDERLSGAEAILSVRKTERPVIVIGVQAANPDSAAGYARHAAKLGADAVIALPPPKGLDLAEYYGRIGEATPLPLIMQAVGDLAPEAIARMAGGIPTLKAVKDEAGSSPLPRIGILKEHLKVFSGNHGVTLMDEMTRGSSGSMPAACLADLYVKAWNDWTSGRRKDAMDAFSKAVLMVPEAQVYGIAALKYVLHLRGVFPHYGVRVKDARAPLDDAGKQTLRAMLDYLKPSLTV